jgi:aminocarboxymuconate-semialdehyde decarboxylase
LKTVIDLHTHVVPPHLAPDTDRGPRWPRIERAAGGNASVVIDGKVFRRIDSRCWDVERRLADMAQDGVTGQVLSPMPELLSHWLAPPSAEHLARITNEHIATMVAAAPDRFVGIGMVCAQDPERATRQLRDVRDLGFCGIEIGTHINGVPLGDPSLHPLYEAAESLELGIFIHPLHPAGLERIGAVGGLGAVAAFPLETALAAVSLLANGILDRFPRLKFLLSHGGGALPWIIPRLDFAWSLGGPFKGMLAERPSEVARWFWFDTILYDPKALRFLAQATDAGHIVVGSDYPFAIRQGRPGGFVEAALEDCDAILFDNAISYLDGGNRKGAFAVRRADDRAALRTHPVGGTHG